KFEKDSVMVWSCFWTGRFGLLTVLESVMNQEVYANSLSQEFNPGSYLASRQCHQPYFYCNFLITKIGLYKYTIWEILILHLRPCWLYDDLFKKVQF
ncbi:hypothetical protein CLU79DRAFT_704452, partial [Phycomyces nitens]